MTYLNNSGSVLDLVREGEVHRDLYTSEAVFDLEIQHLFRNTWVYVGHASQIPNPGTISDYGGRSADCHDPSSGQHH